MTPERVNDLKVIVLEVLSKGDETFEVDDDTYELAVAIALQIEAAGYQRSPVGVAREVAAAKIRARLDDHAYDEPWDRGYKVGLRAALEDLAPFAKVERDFDAAAERLYYAYDQTWNKDVVDWGDERINAKRWTDMARVAFGEPSDEQMMEAFGDAG